MRPSTNCIAAYVTVLEHCCNTCALGFAAQAGRISIVGVYAGFTNNFNIGAARCTWRMRMSQQQHVFLFICLCEGPHIVADGTVDVVAPPTAPS